MELETLVQIALRLTVAARGVDSDSEEATVRRLSGVNELLHQVLGAALADIDERPLPEETITDLLLERAEIHGCEQELAWALRGVIERPRS